MSPELLKTTVRPSPEWLSRFPDIKPGTVALFEAEASADLVAFASELVIPGFLQTPRYSRWMIQKANAHNYPRHIVDQLVETRQMRYENLADREMKPTVVVRIGQSALYRFVTKPDVDGPAIMAEQMDHLLNVFSTTDFDADIRVIPADGPASSAIAGSYTLLFKDDEPNGLSHLETAGEDMVFDHAQLCEELTAGIDDMDLYDVALSSHRSNVAVRQAMFHWSDVSVRSKYAA
jgi:hypothetical protein